MPTLKFLITLVLGLGLVAAQAGIVHAAAPRQDDASITGTVQGVDVEAIPESDSQVVVITLLVKNRIQLVRVSLQTAIDLGLVVLDDGKTPVIVDSLFGTDVTIDLNDDSFGGPVVGEKQHPVGSKVTGFFSNFMDVDYEVVSTSHANGFGFGTITQALWMTKKLGGDATLFQTMLTAKQTKDYQSVALPDGEIPQNWGQFRRSVLQGEEDKNPGDVVSGTDDPAVAVDNNGHETDHGQSKDKDDDHNWRNDRPDIPPGQTKEKDNNGNGTNPVTPPGQNKDKDKDKDKEKDNNGNSGNPPGQDKDKDKSGNEKDK